MFIRSFLFKNGPTPASLYSLAGNGALASLFNPIISAYAIWWVSSQKRLIDWHRHELKQIDFNFEFAEATRELVRAREAARARGVSPLSSDYPDIQNFLSKD